MLIAPENRATKLLTLFVNKELRSILQRFRPNSHEKLLLCMLLTSSRRNGYSCRLRSLDTSCRQTERSAKGSAARRTMSSTLGDPPFAVPRCRSKENSKHGLFCRRNE